MPFAALPGVFGLALKKALIGRCPGGGAFCADLGGGIARAAFVFAITRRQSQDYECCVALDALRVHLARWCDVAALAELIFKWNSFKSFELSPGSVCIKFYKDARI